MAKPFTQSRTLWVNMLIVVVAAVTGAMNTDVVSQNPALMAYLVAGLGAMNIILRLFTKVPVSLLK